MINHHPSKNQLIQFAKGELTSAWSLVISAHVDMCPHCQQQVEEINTQLAARAFDDGGETFKLSYLDKMRFQTMCDDITKLEPVYGEACEYEANGQLELEGRAFKLPRALQRYANKTEDWSKLVGKLWQAPVDLGDMGKAHFIYMEKGGSVPEHTHRGNELTLVINGEFEDGSRHFDTGDFIHLNTDDCHTPVSNHDDGCLVFSFVDEPLFFTSGLARLLNPFSHLFFR